MFDAAILGNGPAGLLAAAACAARGLSVVCVGPEPREPWARSFGLWASDGLGELAEASFARPCAITAAGRVEFDTPYVRLDVPRLQRALFVRACAAGVRWTHGVARALDHGAASTTVHLASGEALTARVVVDATGPASPFVTRRAVRAPAFQAAWGELVAVDHHPYGPGEMALMDFTPPAPAHADSGPATFLYALPLSRDLVFFEETSLVARPAVPFAELRRRLHARLGAMGVAVREVFETERCLIPMGLGLPCVAQRTVAFGAASSFVHPATGYQLGRAVREAAPLAEALAAGLDRGGPAAAARAAYAAIWPRARRRTWELLRFGMEVAASASPSELDALMGAYFALPEPLRLDFLRGTATPAAVLSAMWRVFRAGDRRLRKKLVRSGMGPDASLLVRAALSVSP